MYCLRGDTVIYFFIVKGVNSKAIPAKGGLIGKASWFVVNETTYEDTYVIDQEEYDSEEVVGYTCSVCGATK